MVKSIIVKELICDGCRKPMADDKASVVTFQTYFGLFRYDMCEECCKNFMDILGKHEKEEKKPFKVTLADFSIENRAKYIAENQDKSSTDKVETLGESRIDRDLKILQKMHAKGYSTNEMAKLSGLSHTNIARMSRGDAVAPRASTLDILESMFVKEGFLKVKEGTT